MFLEHSECPKAWKVWLQLPRPRIIHWLQGQRFWTTLIIAALTLTSLLLLGILIAESRAHPPREFFKSDVLTAAPFIVFGLLLSLLAITTLKRDRRLVRDGELVLGKVVGVRTGRRGVKTVTFEFLDRSGRLTTASCVDQTRSFGEGMTRLGFHK